MSMERRDFLKVAASAAAVSAVDTRSLAALDTSEISESVLQQARELVALGNGEPPAMQFQAYPGGTGALMEKLWREHDGNPFERHEIEIEPWSGPVPTGERDIVFLPVHRQAALVRERLVSPVDLLEVYLARMERLDPTLLCAVTIMPDQARAEARAAETEIAAGRWRGPLHGIPYGLKDLFSTRGTRTTWGSSDFEIR